MPRTTSAARRIDTEALKRERPLADVVASYGVVLRRESAGTYRALCPFHQERTPSFWIDARERSSEHYYCFGCTASGDVITFVMERESCSFREACERLSMRGKPPMVEPAPRMPAKSGGRRWEELAADSLEAQVLDRALRLYQDQLWSSRRAREYLKSRGCRRRSRGSSASAMPMAIRCCGRSRPGRRTDTCSGRPSSWGWCWSGQAARTTGPCTASSSSIA